MSEKSDATMEMVDSNEGKSLNPNDIEDVKPKKEKKSSIKYFLELLSDSVVTSVPQIVTTSSLLRKIFKIIVLGACIGGFIYQAVEFMKLYKTYPSSLEIEVKYADKFPTPSVTICNRNPVQKVEFCKEKKEFCAKPTNLTRFCKMYPHHCDENTTLDDLEFIISNEYIGTEDLERFGKKVEDLIEECCSSFFPLADQCRKVSKKLRHFDENNVSQNCYIIDFAKLNLEEYFLSVGDLNTVVEAGKNNCLWWSPLAFEQTFSLMVNVNHKEIGRPDVKPSVQAMIHSTNELKNPFHKGFIMEEGKQYTVTMRIFEENLLPAPYSTNCTDKSKLDKNYNRENCIAECQLNSFIDKCGCMPLIGVLLPNFPKCSDEETATCLTDVENYDELCFRQCPRLCHSSYFEYEVSSSRFKDTKEAIDLGDGPIIRNDSDKNTDRQRTNHNGKGRSFLRMVYSKKELIIYTYKPKYEDIEILGYIGGFSGIWLGVSLVAIFDFIETVVVFFWYLTKNSKLKKHSNR